ncbi:MAG: hypothetical protein ACQEQV_03065 [Fibrobacterota bacterium]
MAEENKKDRMHRELFKKQQRIQQLYQKRLSGKNIKALNTFLSSGKQPGSAEFFKLAPLVQEVVLRLNLTSIEVMGKYTVNPIKKGLFFLQKMMLKRLVPKKNTGKKK